MRAASDPPLRTPSLRWRLTALVLLGVAVLLAVLVVAADRALESRLDGQLRQRLVDRVGVAQALVGQVGTADLARRLEGQGISVLLVDAQGRSYADGPLAQPTTSPGSTGSTGSPGSTGNAGSGTGSPSRPGALPPGQATTPAPAPPTPPTAQATVVQQGRLLSVSTELSDGSTLRLYADADDVASTVRQVRTVLLLTALVVLGVAAVAVPAVVAAGLRPLDRITRVARSISAGDRERRLRPDRPRSELGRTATAFDEMLDEVVGAEARAVASETRLRTFLSDAAHDLRTPLAGVGAAAERLLRDDPPRAEREATLARLVGEVRRSSRLVDDMLLIARIDSGLDGRREPVDLLAVARGAAASQELAAPDVEVLVEGPATTSDGTTVAGDPDQLTRLVRNLVDNAVRATRAAGGRAPVRLVLRRDVAHVVLDVRDRGGGVPDGDQERIFDRLVRLDAARSSQGSGLGLPIARGIARAHGGDVAYVTGASPGGACFRVTLPVSLPASPPGSPPVGDSLTRPVGASAAQPARQPAG